MLPLDPPPEPPHIPVVVLAQAASVKPKMESIPTIGVCHLVAGYLEPDASNSFGFLGGHHRGIEAYLSKVKKKKVALSEDEQLKLYLSAHMVEAPMHGTITLAKNKDEANWYVPAKGFYGKDRATFLTEHAGYKFKVVVFFKVGVGGGTDGYDPQWDKKHCPNGPEWIFKTSTENVPATA